MCGIAGMIMKENFLPEMSQLRSMSDAAKHRGPDGEGFYIDGKVGLGHRRLSIIDLSALGAQPMTYAGNIITYNGEIYNYIEIRETLKAKGYTFKSESDTEVILAAYCEWGTECVHRFNGMWAFAIHDKKKGLVFMSRDRFGVKPFHYCFTENSFLFSSEIRQLLTQLPKRKVDRQILFDFVFLGHHHHTNHTFFENILSLDPGHQIIYDLAKDSFTVSKWYSLEMNNNFRSLSFEDAQKLFEETLNKSIHLRLRADVQVGTCLSGGLDSSYIATVAAKEYNGKAKEKFTAITAKSIEKASDESAFAEMVVNKAGLNWKVTSPLKEDMQHVMDDVIEAQEEPFGGPSVIMQYFVMREAKNSSCKVLLDGQAGDEALLGYDRYYAAYFLQQKSLMDKVKSYFSIIKNSKLNFITLFFYIVYFNNARVRAVRQLRRNSFVRKDFKSYFNLKLLEEIAESSKNISTLQLLEITKIQLQKLFKYEDRNSMRFSIEARVPFADYNVMELAYSLPFAYKANNGWSKYILRKSAAGKLPDEITWRRIKFGFRAPENWMVNKASMMSVIKESEFLNAFINKDKISSGTDDISLWKLYNLAVWSKKFNVTF